MKRHAYRAHIPILILGLLSAPAGWTAGSGERPARHEPVTLSVWEHTPQFEAPLKGVIDDFMGKNPDIKVVYEIKTPDQYYMLLSTAIRAGETPDLFWTNGTATTDLGGLIRQDAVKDLTGQIDVTGIPTMALKLAKAGDRLYLTPRAIIGTRAVYYNKGMFAHYGFVVPKTFSDFESLLCTLKDKGIVPISLGGRFSWSILFHFEPILAALAPDWLDEATVGKARVNDPRVVAAFDKMREWGKKGYYGNGYLGVDEGGQLLAFSKGQSAMTITGSWNADTLRKNNPRMTVGAFQIPTRDGRRPMVVTYHSGFCVSSKTKYPKEAIRLAQYLTSIPAQQIWVDKLNEVPGMPQLQSRDPLIADIVKSDIQVSSFYTILGDYAKPGAVPTQVWEQDNVKMLSGEITSAHFASMLDALMR
jgi:raffinose/stachyose/melibiose transport system substrate-binding protein